MGYEGEGGHNNYDRPALQNWCDSQRASTCGISHTFCMLTDHCGERNRSSPDKSTHPLRSEFRQAVSLRTGSTSRAMTVFCTVPFDNSSDTALSRRAPNGYRLELTASPAFFMSRTIFETGFDVTIHHLAGFSMTVEVTTFPADAADSFHDHERAKSRSGCISRLSAARTASRYLVRAVLSFTRFAAPQVNVGRPSFMTSMSAIRRACLPLPFGNG